MPTSSKAYELMHLSMYCPTAPPPPPLGHIWGYSEDLTQPNVKCPIVGQTYRVKSPQLQRGIYSGFDIAKEVTTKNIWVLTERSSNSP